MKFIVYKRSGPQNVNRLPDSLRDHSFFLPHIRLCACGEDLSLSFQDVLTAMDIFFEGDNISQKQQFDYYSHFFFCRSSTNQLCNCF